MAGREESSGGELLPEARLGAALRQAREAMGISLRGLARKLYRSHSTLVEYERGHRLAPLDVVQAYETELSVESGTLVALYEAALTALYGEDGSRRRTYVPKPPLDATLYQLPPDIAHFTGREAELGKLRAVIADSATRGETAVVISAIAGMGGVGKTALALHLAHELTPQFPDAQLYVNLHGYEPAQCLAPTQALDRFLRALGVTGEALPTELDEQAARYRALLTGKHALVVIDNASSAEQVRPLLPGSRTCLVLITSRDRLAGLVARDGARLLDLDVLSPDDAIQLLAHVAGHRRVAREPEAVAEVVRLCGYLPLAVRISAAKLVTRPTMSIAALAGRLADEQHRLDELAAGDARARASFALSYEDLDPPAARMFRRLGLIAGPDFAVGVASVLADIPLEEAEALLETLVDAHLIETAPTPGRYRFHDLLRLYARERVQVEETEDDRHAALRRMLEWYLVNADAAEQLLLPGRRRLPLARAGEFPRNVFTARAQALAWFEAERASLVAATQQAADYGLNSIVWLLPDALWSFFFLRKYWVDWQETHQVGLVAARKANNRRAEAWMVTSLGVAYRELRRFEEALDCHQQGLALCCKLEDPWIKGRVLERLGVTYRELRRFDEAVDCLERNYSGIW